MSHYQSRAIDPTVYPAISDGINDGHHSRKLARFSLSLNGACGCCLDTLYREHERGTLTQELRCAAPTCHRIWTRDTAGRWVIAQPSQPAQRGRRRMNSLRHGRARKQPQGVE